MTSCARFSGFPPQEPCRLTLRAITPWARMLLALAFSLMTSIASAQTGGGEPPGRGDRAVTSGLSVGMGLGHSSAGIGGNAAYYLQLPNERWRLALHVGVGVLGYVMTDHDADGRVGAAGGIMAAFGRRHRLVLDVLAAPYQADMVLGESIKLYYGIGALAGYQWMARFGLELRAGVGVAFCPTRAGAWGPAFDLVSIGYKFW